MTSPQRSFCPITRVCSKHKMNRHSCWHNKPYMTVCTFDVRSRWKMPLLCRYCSPLAMSRDRPILTLHDRYMSLSSSCSRSPPFMYYNVVTLQLLSYQPDSPFTPEVWISMQCLTSVRAWSCPSWTHTPKNLMKVKTTIYFLYFWIPFVNMQLQPRIIFQQDT